MTNNLATRLATGLLLPLCAGAIGFVFTEAWFLVLVGARWQPSVDGNDTTAALLAALPLALPLALASLGAAMGLRRLGWWALLPAAVTPVFVVGLVALNVDWLEQAGHHVENAASLAYEQNAFFLSRWLWDRLEGLAALLFFPFVVVLWFVDLVLLPLVILLSPVFLVALGLFAVKAGLLAGVGMLLATAICAPVLSWVAKHGARPRS